MMKPTLHKVLWYSLLVVCITASNLFTPLHGQDEEGERPTLYVQFDYMKSAPGANWAAMETEIWKPIHEQRIQNGEIADWILMEVRYPYGAVADYDYVTMTIFAGHEKLEGEDLDWGAVFSAAHPGKDYDKVMQRTENTRTFVKSDVFELIGTAGGPGEDTGTPEWLVVNYMRVPEAKGWDYVGMEMDYYMPIHARMIELGLLMDWALMGRVFPRGADSGYQFMTFDVYGSWNNIFAGPDENPWKLSTPMKMERRFGHRCPSCASWFGESFGTWLILRETKGKKQEWQSHSCFFFCIELSK